MRLLLIFPLAFVGIVLAPIGLTLLHARWTAPGGPGSRGVGVGGGGGEAEPEPEEGASTEAGAPSAGREKLRGQGGERPCRKRCAKIETHAGLSQTFADPREHVAEATPFLVLKRGHSGSTWFSALLLGLPKTYFVDEAVPASAATSPEGAAALEGFLVAGLTQPLGKISSYRQSLADFGATWRPPGDYWKNLSFAYRIPDETKACLETPDCQLAALGMSLAPLAGKARRGASINATSP